MGRRILARQPAALDSWARGHRVQHRRQVPGRRLPRPDRGQGPTEPDDRDAHLQGRRDPRLAPAALRRPPEERGRGEADRPADGGPAQGRDAGRQARQVLSRGREDGARRPLARRDRAGLSRRALREQIGGGAAGLDSDNPQLQELRQRLEQEEAAYAECLKAVDALASFPLPEEQIKNLTWLLGRLNSLWQAPPKPETTGLQGAFGRRAWDAVAPAIERQTDFNSMLVQTLNGQVEENAKLHAHLRTLVGALLRYLQRLLPLIDARDRTASAQAVERAELILEAFERRLESLARRLEGLLAMRDRLDTLGEELHGV